MVTKKQVEYLSSYSKKFEETLSTCIWDDVYSAAFKWTQAVNACSAIEGVEWDYGTEGTLDFDGGLVKVCSRFYPPHKNKGDWWEGTISVYCVDRRVSHLEIKKRSLQKLLIFVCNHVERIEEGLKEYFQVDKE